MYVCEQFEWDHLSWLASEAYSLGLKTVIGPKSVKGFENCVNGTNSRISQQRYKHNSLAKCRCFSVIPLFVRP